MRRVSSRWGVGAEVFSHVTFYMRFPRAAARKQGRGSSGPDTGKKERGGLLLLCKKCTLLMSRSVGSALRHTKYPPDTEDSDMVASKGGGLEDYLLVLFFYYFFFLAQNHTRLIPPYYIAFFSLLLVSFCLVQGIAPGRTPLPSFLFVSSRVWPGRGGREVHVHDRRGRRRKRGKEGCPERWSSTWIIPHCHSRRFLVTTYFFCLSFLAPR